MIGPTLFLLFVLLTVSATGVPTYEVNLDLPPEHRYDRVIADYKPLLVKAYTEIMDTVSDRMKALVVTVYTMVTRQHFREYSAELVGVARCLNISESNAFVFNVVYELQALCTSIVFKNAEGKTVVARNLDFPFTPILRKTYVMLSYTQGGRERFRCSGNPGFIGGITCMRGRAFALSLNLRVEGDSNAMLRSLTAGFPPLTWLIRTAMHDSNNYQDFSRLLKESRAASGGYLTISGLAGNEGAVLTRDRKGAEDVQELNDTTWFLAQCNMDHWLQPWDRRTARANEGMNEIGQGHATLEKVNNELLFKVPLYNTLTVATVLMSPADDSMEVIVRTMT